MTQFTMSLIDVLVPPENPWLKKLSKSKANLPAGVRVVRFTVDDDDRLDNYQEVIEASDRQRPLVTDSKEDLSNHA